MTPFNRASKATEFTEKEPIDSKEQREYVNIEHHAETVLVPSAKPSILAAVAASLSQRLMKELERLIDWSIEKIYRPMLEQARKPRLVHENVDYRFWTSRAAFFIYVDAGMSVASRQMWLLHGILLVLVAQIAWVVLRWSFYTVEDPEVWAGVNFLSTWAKRFLKEGQGVLEGTDSVKLIMAGAVVKTSSTGAGYFKAIIRYKMATINLRAVKDLESRNMYLAEARRRFPSKLRELRALNRSSSKPESSKASIDENGGA